MSRDIDPRDATRPSAGELDRLIEPLDADLLRAAAAATAPPDAETRRLIARASRRGALSTPRRGPTWGLPAWGGLALAAGLGIAILLAGAVTVLG